ncbi:MAG: hypothetical protein IJX39_10255 [Clostridia bacterium]|nr:hypothetical protein [Clostridia bacterium]
MEKKLLARYPLGNPHRVWRQDNLLLNIASAGPMGLEIKNAWTMEKTRRAVKTCMDAGFNMIGTLWGSPEIVTEIVRTAERLGGNVLYQNLKRFGGMGHKHIFCEKNDLQGAIRDTECWRSIKGYCLWDEPILEEHLHETHCMIELCEKERPDVLPYTVANPSYNSRCRWEDGAYAPYIDRFLDIINPAQMSFDYYPIGRPEYDPALQLDHSTMWCDLETVRRAAQKHSVPFWFAYQGQRFPWHKIYYTFHFDMARAMAYAGILHGAKGLECYTEFNGFVDPATGGCGAFYEEQKRLNGELLALGNTLMALTCLRVIHDDTLLPECPYMEGLRTSMEESELLEGGLTPRISVSEHSDAYGNRYLMVLNRDYDQTAHLELKLKQPSRVYEVSKKDGEQHLCYDDAKSLPILLQPGDLALYRIQPADEAPFTVEYYLEKAKAAPSC